MKPRNDAIVAHGFLLRPQEAAAVQVQRGSTTLSNKVAGADDARETMRVGRRAAVVGLDELSEVTEPVGGLRSGPRPRPGRDSAGRAFSV